MPIACWNECYNPLQRQFHAGGTSLLDVVALFVRNLEFLPSPCDDEQESYIDCGCSLRHVAGINAAGTGANRVEYE
jgi:hypothetical protein